jgi:hypothetical protein
MTKTHEDTVPNELLAGAWAIRVNRDAFGGLR